MYFNDSVEAGPRSYTAPAAAADAGAGVVAAARDKSGPPLSLLFSFLWRDEEGRAILSNRSRGCCCCCFRAESGKDRGRAGYSNRESHVNLRTAQGPEPVTYIPGMFGQEKLTPTPRRREKRCMLLTTWSGSVAVCAVMADFVLLANRSETSIEVILLFFEKADNHFLLPINWLT